MNLGFSEMLFIFLLALIIFGPKKLPEIGRQVGKALAEFKRASNEFKSQLETEMRQIEIEEMLRKEKDSLGQVINPAADAVTHGSLSGPESHGNALPPPSEEMAGAAVVSEAALPPAPATDDPAEISFPGPAVAATNDVAGSLAAPAAVPEADYHAAAAPESQPVAATTSQPADGEPSTLPVAAPARNLPADMLAKSDVVKGTDA